MQFATDTLYVEQRGNPQHPCILFLHSGGLSSKQWMPQFEQLGDEYYCLAPDLPEQGRSSQVRPFTLHRSAMLLADLIRERVPQGRVHVVGLALGGAVALTLMRIAPQLLGHVLVSGTATGMGKILGGLSLKTDPLYSVMPADAVVKSAFAQVGIPEKYRDLLLQDMIRSTEGDFLRSYARELINISMPHKATSPLLIVVGQNESEPAKQAVKSLVTSIDGARGVEIANVGHVWNLQQPTLFCDLVRTWLQHQQFPPEIHQLA